MSNFEEVYNESEKETYSYQGQEVVIVTVFHDGERKVAIVEDETGEQYEVFADTLY